jgi:hypothetical protein
MPQNLKFVVSAVNETEKVFSDVGKAVKKIDKQSAGMSKSLKMAGSVAKTAGLAIVSGLATAGTTLVATTLAAQEAAAEIDNLSRIAGVTSSEFQTLTYAALDYGIAQDKVSDILKDVNDKVGDFLSTGAGPMQDFFTNIAPQVGVTAENFAKLSSKDALQLYISSLEKANLSQSEMTFYMEAIASDSTALIPLFKEGGKAIAEQAAEAEKLGIILSDTDVALLDAANDATEKAKIGFSALGQQIGVKFSPLISDLSDRFFGVAAEAGGFGEIATKVFNAVIKAAGFLANAIGGIGLIFDGLKLAVVSFLEFAYTNLAKFEKSIVSLINKIPGVSISVVGVYENIAGNLGRIKEDIKSDINEFLAAPPPSEALEVWSETVTRKYRETAEQLAEIKNEAIQADAETSQQAQETIREQREMSKEEEIQSELEKNGVMAQHIQQRINLEKASELEKSRFLIENSANVFKAFSGQSRKVFEMQKALSISETLISTYQSATSAYKAMAGIPVVGPALGVAAAAAAIAAGKANVDQIRSQKFSGQAHDGLAMVPNTGTYLLEKGERVVKKEDNKKLSQALDQGMGGDVSVTFEIKAMDTQSATDVILRNENVIVSVIQEAFEKRGVRGPLG